MTVESLLPPLAERGGERGRSREGHLVPFNPGAVRALGGGGGREVGGVGVGVEGGVDGVGVVGGEEEAGVAGIPSRRGGGGFGTDLGSGFAGILGRANFVPQVEHADEDLQNIDKQTLQTYPVSIIFLSQKHEALKSTDSN